MKTEQIQLVLELSKCGSISQAAQNLFIAQPNASNSLYALEKELGYKIINRTHNGVTFTEKGEVFLQYARSIQRSLENIYALKNEEKRIRLSVAAYAYPFTENAFSRFCKKYTHSANSLNCSMKRIGTIKEGIDMLLGDLSDVSIVVCRRELYGYFEKIFNQNELLSTLLAHVSLYITMSENHPLAQKKPQNVMDYAEYPCISNAGLTKNLGTPEIEALLQAVNMHIVMGPTEARLDLLESSNSFAITTPYPKEALAQHHLISRSIPNSDRLILLLTKEEGRENKEIIDYIKLVKQEVNVWLKNI